jgi:RNA polymerase sigma-70 factor (ECF subfamily)
MPTLDRDTFEQLVRRHHAAVLRSAMRVVRRLQDAEDVTQEVFLRLFRGQVPLEGEPTSPGPLCWLATRLALNALRAARRRRAKELPAMSSVPSAASPDQHAAGNELHAAVAAAVETLPDDLRLPLLLRYQDELTLRAVGSALGIAETTVHGRVQTALERLRRQLAERGFALAAANVTAQIAELPAPLPPGALLDRLLAVPQTATLACGGLAKFALAAALLLCGAVGVWWAVSASGEPATQRVAAARVASSASSAAQDPPREPQEPRQPVPAGAVPQDPAPSHAAFSGTVRDALDWGAAGVRVVAVAAGNLKPFVLATTHTDALGAFALPVPFDGDPVRASRIRFQVFDQAQLLLEGEELQLTTAAARLPVRLLLPPEAGFETTRFTLTCAVRGPDGAPMAGVKVQMFRRSASGPRLGWERPDVEVTTDGDGSALLTGRSVGEKILFVDARPQGLRAGIQWVMVREAGAYSASITLAPGRSWRGRLVEVGGAPLEWANVWLEEQDPPVAHFGKLGANGAVEFGALGDGPFLLHVDAHPFSPALVRGLLPDGAPVTIALKRANDLRDHGAHLAEVHGRLVEASDSAPLEVPPFAVEVLPVLPGTSTLATDCVVPPPPAQRASDGRSDPDFHMVGLAPGRYAVVARLADHAAAVEFVDLRESEIRTEVVVRLQRGAAVRGRVVRADGSPAAEAFVFVAGIGERGDGLIADRDAAQQTAQPRHWHAMLASSARCTQAGTFELAHVPVGVALRVVAVAEGAAPGISQTVILQEGQAADGFELRLAPR